MGPQADFVDHHRRHGDGVAARPRPLRFELFGASRTSATSSAIRPVRSSTSA